MFGTQPSLGPTCLLCLHFLDSLSSLFELFLFLCFCLCGVLLWVLVCFLSIFVVILGLSFLDCSVLMLFILLRVLAARLCVGGFLGCLLAGTFRGGGSYGYGQPGGVNIFFGFSHSRGVWVKTAAALGEECFSKLLSLKNPHLSGENGRPFSILSQETL